MTSTSATSPTGHPSRSETSASVPPGSPTRRGGSAPREGAEGSRRKRNLSDRRRASENNLGSSSNAIPHAGGDEKNPHLASTSNKPLSPHPRGGGGRGRRRPPARSPVASGGDALFSGNLAQGDHLMNGASLGNESSMLSGSAPKTETPTFAAGSPAGQRHHRGRKRNKRAANNPQAPSSSAAPLVADPLPVETQHSAGQETTTKRRRSDRLLAKRSSSPLPDAAAGPPSRRKRPRKPPFSKRTWQEQKLAEDEIERQAILLEEKERKRLKRVVASSGGESDFRPSAPRNTTQFLIENGGRAPTKSFREDQDSEEDEIDEHGSMMSFSRELLALRGNLRSSGLMASSAGAGSGAEPMEVLKPGKSPAGSPSPRSPSPRARTPRGHES